MILNLKSYINKYGDNMKNLWQMQLHPNNSNWDIKEIDKLLLHHSVIGMGNEWKNDRGKASSDIT